ncbi:hypothetical protein ACET3Z_007971 [Daucus carota]
MACCMPLKSRNLDVNLLVLKPTVFLDELVEALKHFTSWSLTFGCIHSAILQTIHGNVIIWYGAWMKKSHENKKLLDSASLLMLERISSVADIIDNNFFEPYGGESKNGSLAATFSTGDTVSFSVIAHSSHDNASQIDLPYAVLATFQPRFLVMDGATSGVCLKKNYDTTDNSHDRGSNDYVLNFFVWESLEACYSSILRSDMKNINFPHLGGMSLPMKYEVYRVIYVSGDDELDFKHSPWSPHLMLQAG